MISGWVPKGSCRLLIVIQFLLSLTMIYLGLCWFSLCPHNEIRDIHCGVSVCFVKLFIVELFVWHIIVFFYPQYQRNTLPSLDKTYVITVYLTNHEMMQINSEFTLLTSNGSKAWYWLKSGWTVFLFLNSQKHINDPHCCTGRCVLSLPWTQTHLTLPQFHLHHPAANNTQYSHNQTWIKPPLKMFPKNGTIYS